MPRLFLAIDLSAEILADLQQVLPEPRAGVRPVAAAHLHLTLHFLGETDLAGVVRALDQFEGAAFPLRIRGMGRFPGRDRSSILWAGVVPNPSLLDLHRRLGRALSAAGHELDPRRYAPHITLARCNFRADAEFLTEHLARHQDFESRPAAVTSFELNSSLLTDRGPQYRREHSWPLVDRGKLD